MEQCGELRKNLAERFADVRDAAIVVSPMRRTIQTALLSLDWLLERGIPMQADARWQGMTLVLLFQLSFLFFSFFFLRSVAPELFYP